MVPDAQAYQAGGHGRGAAQAGPAAACARDLSAPLPAAVRARPVRTALLLCALALVLSACVPSPEQRLKRTRIPADPSRTLAEVFEAYPHFSSVTWTSYPRDGATMARVTGIFDLDSLVRKTSGTRIFAARDRAALERAGANLGFVMEFAMVKDAEPVRTLMEARVAAIGWDRSGALPDEAVLMEIVRGQAGDATMRVVLDAADYCREHAPTRPGRH